MYQFSVLIYPAPDVEGEWIAHCLNLDVMSQGRSPAHAQHMLVEALVLAIEDDLAAGLDPTERPRAPRDRWILYDRTLHHGERIPAAELDRLKNAREAIVAATLYMERAKAPPPEDSDPEEALLEVPAPFIVAALRGQGWNHDPASKR